MTTPPVTTITDELLAELEQLAGKVSAMALDSAEEVVSQSGRMIECPVCGGEGYASAENDYCNFDNHAIGVEFYGIGPEFGLAEAYFRAANPATILALLQHVRELRVKADRYDWIAREHNDEHGGIWVAAWDRDKFDWISLDAAFRPENDSELDLDAAVDAARSSTTG